jgi:uncharacterized protein (TIGR02246 family)
MRALLLGLLTVALPCSAFAAPFTKADDATLRAMSAKYVEGWLKNDRQAVMSVMAKDSVFIPHDGVKPRVGYDAIDAFWFPGGKAVGTVPAFTMAITDIKGADDHATLYGRSDLTYEASGQRYNWIGSFLIVARREGGRWLFTHMMSSDEQPKVEDIGAKTGQ